MTGVEDLTRDYRAAFLRYLPQRSEAALTLGYEIGRRAVGDGLSPLDLVGVHHVVLAEVLDDLTNCGAGEVARAGPEFLLEVLATFDMAYRSLDPLPRRRPHRLSGTAARSLPLPFEG